MTRKFNHYQKPLWRAMVGILVLYISTEAIEFEAPSCNRLPLSTASLSRSKVFSCCVQDGTMHLRYLNSTTTQPPYHQDEFLRSSL
ncbi:hypothetical protein V8C26DRAFT_400108 [Trichoderma gracile]